jgi:hypothetical protein
VLTSSEALDAWRLARGVRRPVLPVRLPGKLGHAFRSGYLVTSAQPTGQIAWGDYLHETYGEPASSSR